MDSTHTEIAKLTDQIRFAKSPDERARIAERIFELGQKATTGRKAQFSMEDAELPHTGKDFSITDLADRRPRTDEEREVAQFADDCLIVARATGRETHETKFFRKTYEVNPYFRKALDTSGGANWIGQEFSSQMHEQVRQQMQVATLVENIQMPSGTYTIPVEGSDATPYLLSESAGADDDLDTNKRAVATLTSPNLGKVVLTAKKVAARVVVSNDFTEDSIVPALPYIRTKLARAMAYATEDAIINGKASGSHLDADVTDAKDHRKAYDGLRQIISGASYENGVALVQASTAGSLDVADLRKLRAKMDRYATRPQDLMWIASSVAYFKLLGLRDGSGASPVQTLDKYGSQATLVTGEMARIDGAPVVLSDWVRSDLNHSGVFDGTTTDASLLLLVNRKQFVFGSRRNPTLKSRDNIDVDSTSLVITQRTDFKPFLPTQPCAGMIYDVRR
jgi:HK97 family phage major capsid protein